MIDLSEMSDNVRNCTRCPLAKGRKNAVFGMGDTGASLMFVGEAPGRVEDEQGLPFVGPAGALLDELLGGVGMSRKETYITNVVKCRPPGNRDPLPQEIRACREYLEAQIEAIEPAVICALGRVAAGVMMEKNVQITKVHGQKFPGPGYFVVPVFHPAAALRTPRTRSLLEEDFRRLSQYLEEGEEPPGRPALEPEQLDLF